MAPLLKVEDLRTQFFTSAATVKAVDGVTFEVNEGETIGIVGESGCGKSVTALSILRLVQEPGRIVGGRILFKDKDVVQMTDDEIREFRGSDVAMIFQDPMTSLNPVLRVGFQIQEAMDAHQRFSHREARDRVVPMLEKVRIPAPAQRAKDYPHQFSGGMRQRAMIAMSIANEPDVLIADEPTTALDVTIQAQVLEVMERIQERTNSAILLITHDLGVVAGVADRVIVMYAGRAVEVGGVDQIFYEPQHPYTLGLLASLPRLDEERRDVRLHRIRGQPPSLVHVPSGCAFHPRCEFARCPEPCSTEVPELRALGELDHVAACHFAEEVVKLRPDDLKTEAS
jgi:oligopeptide/dipeptide ABC transporter ATP-binding protein